MSALSCPQCGGRSRCACLTPRDAAGTYQGETRGEFDQEWVRPYLPAQDALPDDGADGATVTWVIPRVPREADLPPEPGGTLPPVVMTQAHRRGREAPKRRRAVHLAAALAGLAGSAAIAGAYAFSQSSDTTDVAGPPPASRLEVLDGGEEPSASPTASQADITPPATVERTATAPGHDAVGTSATGSAPASPSGSASAPVQASDPASPPFTSPGASDASLPVPGQGAPSATTAAPTPETSAPGRTLRRQDRGPDVVELQQRLRQLGLWPHPLRGHFNRHLQDAVQRFQAEHGISDDSPGVYGPATRHQLESMTS
ncbi:peptidoglycan-binding domain-containing protein [Streptomyces sp. CB02261]|uniref:peptidoglycan-binding domain-containing protein n=1 Tax=Streptomyces sp. CB02261 TaxID=1703940 RepID=UPI000AC7926D|nr:peptidoglycan-binding domain-containing protein [Streptomyces sp. CB02261]